MATSKECCGGCAESQRDRELIARRLKDRPCPNCGCRSAHSIDDDLLVLCCDACQTVFGFDDTTPQTELYAPDECQADSCGYRQQDFEEWPEERSACADDVDPPAAARREDVRQCSGYRSDCSSKEDADGCCRSRYSHHDRRRSGHCHSGHGGQRDDEDDNHTRTSSTSSSSPSSSSTGAGLVRSLSVNSPLIGQVLDASTRVAGSLLAGSLQSRVGHIAGSATSELEPIGQSVGAVIGGIAGKAIMSGRGEEIGRSIGATVGRGVAEMVRDSRYFPGTKTGATVGVCE